VILGYYMIACEVERGARGVGDYWVIKKRIQKMSVAEIRS